MDTKHHENLLVNKNITNNKTWKKGIPTQNKKTKEITCANSY
jgi:hypothetical protein